MKTTKVKEKKILLKNPIRILCSKMSKEKLRLDPLTEKLDLFTSSEINGNFRAFCIAEGVIYGYDYCTALCKLTNAENIF